MRLSLTANLMLSTAVTLVAGLLCVFGSWALLTHFQPSWLRDRDLAGMARDVAEGIAFDGQDRPTSVHLRHTLQQVMEALPQDVFYQVIDPKGKVLFSSNGDFSAFLPAGADPQQAHDVSTQLRSGLKLRVIVLPVTRANMTNYVLVARSDRFDETLLENDASTVKQAAAVESVGAMVAFALVVLVTINRMLRRLKDISAAAARIDPTNLQARLAVEDVPREIVPLIESFNLALGRLEAGFRIQQEFLATAAHELKTPLALIRGEFELDGPTNRKAILADLDHMSRHVHQLLHLAEVSDVNNLVFALTDITLVVEDAVESIARLTQARHIRVRIDHPSEPVMIDADASALFALIRNLVENAANHAPDRSTILVTINPMGISVRDEGPGIPPGDMPKLFKRFWRGAHRRDKGAGLGLSICSEVARGHGWSLSAHNLQPSGAEFTVEFGSQIKAIPVQV
jgi:two-component system, OmpR family, sensor histidine kinase QseC